MANTLRWFSILSMFFVVSACSGRGGTLLSFLSEDAEDDYGTVVASEPNEISNLVSWFKADQILSAQSTSGDPLNEWPSALANSSSLVVPAGQTAPVISPWSSSLQALKFSANANHMLRMPGFNLGAFDTFTLVLTVKSSGASQIASFGSDLYSDEDAGSVGIRNGKVESRHVSFAQDFNQHQSPTIPTDVPHVIVATFSSSSDWRENHLYIDGFRATEVTGSDTGTPTPFVSLVRHLKIGSSTAGDEFLLGEIAVFGRILSPREVYSLSKGLGQKWNISIKEKITKEIFTDKIETGEKEITFESLKKDIFATKGCLGCHNSSLKADGIDLSSYASLKTAVSSSSAKRTAIPGQGSSSGLYLSVIGGVPQMPKLASSFGGYLSEAQRAQILTWINKGMKENESAAPLPLEDSEDGGSADGGSGSPSTLTLYDDVSYGIISSKCLTCHSPTNKSGGVDLSSYTAIMTAVNSSSQKVVNAGSPNTSRLYQVVSGFGLTNSLPTMPKTAIFLSTAEQELIKKWIQDGALQSATSIQSGPSGFVSSTSATFTFSSVAPSGTTVTGYECSVNAGSYTSCTSPKTYSGLSMGAQSFQVRYVDSNGQRSSASTASWVVDFLAPTVTISSPPALITNSTSPGFSFTGVDSGTAGVLYYQCRLDTDPYATCTSRKTFSGVAAGSHTFDVRAIDAAGNIGDPASYAWLIDRTNPTVSLLSPTTGPIGMSSSISINWSASDANGLATDPVKLEYTLNGGTTWVVITAATANSPPYSFTLPGTATTNFRVRVTIKDAAGNSGSASSSNITLN